MSLEEKQPVATARRHEVFEVLQEREGWYRLDLPFEDEDGWVAARDTRPYP